MMQKLAKNKSNSNINNKMKLNLGKKTQSNLGNRSESKFLPLDWMQYFFMFVMHPFFKLSCPRLVLDMNMNQAVVLGQVGQYYKSAM